MKKLIIMLLSATPLFALASSEADNYTVFFKNFARDNNAFIVQQVTNNCIDSKGSHYGWRPDYFKLNPGQDYKYTLWINIPYRFECGFANQSISWNIYSGSSKELITKLTLSRTDYWWNKFQFNVSYDPTDKIKITLSCKPENPDCTVGKSEVMNFMDINFDPSY